MPLHPKWALLVFLMALAGHLYFATYNWTWGFMQGHEFRQAQTAIIAEYIDRQDNFGLYYETPILGKPWAFPLEFPLYQWAVVTVRRTLDVPLFEAARAVSLASFYTALPAFWLLLGSFGVSYARRWIVLAVTLFCPAFIFYSRAFLIDPFAMAASAWFLAAFVRLMDTRRAGWLGLAVTAGTIGALVKSLVFAVWLFPAACYGGWCLWRCWRENGWGRAVGATIAWGLGSAALPLTALRWWIAYTDAIKEGHRSAYIFTSKNLSVGNFGTFSLDSRLSVETWRELFARWSEAIAEPWLIGLSLTLGLVLARRARDRALIAGSAAIWMFGQLAFPYAYAYQDYYFYAGAAFLTIALGFSVVGIWEDGRGPRLLRVLLAVVPCAGMARAYASFYFPAQAIKSMGGSGLAEALRDFLPEKSVLMCLGQDWSAILPYYSKHRALMVRNGLDADRDYLDGAITDLADEDIGAVVITGNSRNNRSTIEYLTKRLGLVVVPICRHADSDIYVTPTYYVRFRDFLKDSSYDGIRIAEEFDAAAEDYLATYELSPGSSRATFPMIQPGASRYRIKFGFNSYPIGECLAMSIHPPSDVWLNVNGPGQGLITIDYGLTDPSWNRDVTEGDKTDGVEFAVWAEQKEAGQTRRLIWLRYLNPRAVEADRGIQQDSFEFKAAAGEQLVLTTRPGNTLSYDWAFLTRISVQPPPREKVDAAKTRREGPGS